MLHRPKDVSYESCIYGLSASSSTFSLLLWPVKIMFRRLHILTPMKSFVKLLTCFKGVSSDWRSIPTERAPAISGEGPHQSEHGDFIVLLSSTRGDRL